MVRENQTSEHLLKLAALNEFEKALGYKRSYEELTHGMLGLMQEFLHYCKKNGIAIPDTQTYYRIVSHVQSLILASFSPNDSEQREDSNTNRTPP